MRDFAQQLPIIVFLKMVDLPLEHRARLLEWVGAGIRTSDTATRDRARTNLNAYIVDLVNQRLKQPGEDILSQALQARAPALRTMLVAQSARPALAEFGRALTERFAEAAGEMAGLHEAAASRDFADGKGVEAAIGEEALGDLETNSHELVTESRTGLREQVVKVAFGNAVVVGDSAGAQASLVAAVADRAADASEKLFTAGRGLRLGSGGERQ
jgi:hypothetical protein